jgi:hypothetical protein
MVGKEQQEDWKDAANKIIFFGRIFGKCEWTIKPENFHLHYLINFNFYY